MGKLNINDIAMKRIIALFVIVTSVWSLSDAQTIITGTVLNRQGKPMDAYITASNRNSGSIIGFADTDSKGYYRLEFNSQADSIVVKADGMEIGQLTKVVVNRTQKLDFHVTEKMIQLREVSVRARKINQNGDTLNYIVGAYKQQNDRTIGDVLKRMPGIKVSDNGGISFNGKKISNFYVEDMDLLAGRYGLATNNVSASDVATVQVLENHQPVKMLQGNTLTDDVAINLRLKESAKGTLAINVMLGGGVQQSGDWHIGNRSGKEGAAVIGQNPLWTAEVVCMYFAKRRQNMTLYKGNNTGDDVSKELTQHLSTINSVGLYPFCPTAAIMPNGSGLPQKRTFDNHSHILTINHLEKFNKDTESGLNIAYHNDRIRREGNSVENYFISNDSRLLTTETMTSETKINNLNIQARYKWNSPAGFAANVLKCDINWNSDQVDGMLSSERTGSAPVNYGKDRVSQHFDRPQLSVSNTFNTIRSIGKNTVDLYFSAGYAHTPSNLTVEIDSILQDRKAIYSQDVNSHHIAARFNTGYNIRVAKAFRLNYNVSASANLHGIVTDLEGFTPPPGNSRLNNDLWYNTYCLVLGQSYKYERNDLDFTLGLPLELYIQTLDDKISRKKHSYIHLLFSPSFTFNWNVTRDLWFNAGAYYSKVLGDPGGIYSGYIMSNYRTFQRSYVEQLSESRNYSANVSLRYRSVINALFVNGSFNFRRTRDNQIYGYSYEGATSVVQAVDKPTVADSYGVNCDASKGFDFLNSTIRLFGSYNISENERLIARDLYRYHSDRLSYGGTLTFKPVGLLSIVYGIAFGRSISYTAGHRDQSTTVCNSTQRISMSLYPTKTLTLTLAAEDNYNNLTAENRHAWFGDASAKLKLKHIDLELQLNNLFDQRQYSRVSYNGLDIYTQTSQLRPRNVLLSIRFKLL